MSHVTSLINRTVTKVDAQKVGRHSSTALTPVTPVIFQESARRKCAMRISHKKFSLPAQFLSGYYVIIFHYLLKYLQSR